jgi:hypothetical protein
MIASAMPAAISPYSIAELRAAIDSAQSGNFFCSRVGAEAAGR